MKTIAKLYCLALLALTVIACQTTTNGYSGHNPVQRTQTNELNTIVFIDHNLNRTVLVSTPMGKKAKSTVKVTIDRSGFRTTETGTTEVWSVLRNRTDYDLQVEGKTLFFDKGQAPLDDESVWRRVYIPANGTAVYREMSLNDRAEYFLVELREGR